MFTPEENIIKCVFAYELLHSKTAYDLYPESLGMSVAEFIDENRIRLRDLTKKIIKNYRIKITSQHSGPIDAAIRFFLHTMNRRDLGQGMGIDILERQAKLEEYKANKQASFTGAVASDLR